MRRTRARRRRRVDAGVARVVMLLSVLALVAATGGLATARLSGMPVAGCAVALAIVHVALRVWLGRLPPSFRPRSLVRHRRRSARDAGTPPPDQPAP